MLIYTQYFDQWFYWKLDIFYIVDKTKTKTKQKTKTKNTHQKTPNDGAQSQTSRISVVHLVPPGHVMHHKRKRCQT